MKICILGSFEGRLDEGMANVSYNIFFNLRMRYSNLMLMNAKEAIRPKFWKSILGTRPDIIHYVSAPTLKQLIFLKLLQLLTFSRTIVSATQPALHKSKLFKVIAFFLKPNVVLVQSHKSESFFKSVNYKTKVVHNGVDTEKFVPVNDHKKKEIRRKYGINEDEFIVLHVGPIRSGRNQRALSGIRNCRILLIVSITNPSQEAVYKELAKTQAIIWNRYFPNIEEIYWMADVYVWAAFEELEGIETPLSILEAMACNLPIISTKYGALSRIFRQSEGLILIDREQEINDAILEIKSGIKTNTRKKVHLLSWTNIVMDISKVYEEFSVERSHQFD